MYDSTNTTTTDHSEGKIMGNVMSIRTNLVYGVLDESETAEQAITRMTDGLDVVCEVLHEEGQAGPWAIVQYTGSRADIRELLIKRLDVDVATADEWLSTPAV